MKSLEYKKQLLDSIPVITGLGLDIVDVQESQVILKAPLDKNINYEGTAFGGSLNTVAILSCYLLAHHILKQSEVPFKSLVIQDSQIKYLKPVQGDFIARSQIQSPKARDFFIRTIKSKKVARIELTSYIYSEHSQLQGPLVQFQGRFVASL